MPTKRPPLVTDEIYHVVVRGVDGRNIFRNDADYYRAIHDVYEFNDDKPVVWQFRRNFSSSQSFENSSRTIEFRQIKDNSQKRDLLVRVLAFCLMPNHIHFLLQQLKDEGVTKFMRKFGAGYAGYFNNKYGRQGHLFQGRFRAVYIKTVEQLKAVFVYIHTNPAILVDSGWKDGDIKSPRAVIAEIEKYKWSSYQDYLGKKNFPSLTQREIFNGIMSSADWRKYVSDWVFYKKGWFNQEDIILE